MKQSLHPIILTAQKGNSQKFLARRRNEKFKKVRERILQRDNHTCQFCGFYSKKYQQVVNIDHNYRNNSSSNLATACLFCTQCFFLDMVGNTPYTGGTIIQCPEMTQAELNNFCRVLFCSLEKETVYRNKLQAVYLSLRDRGEPVDECFGPSASDPRIFGQTMIDCYLKKEQQTHPVLGTLRLLPTKKAFDEPIAFWKDTTYAQVPI